jgi:hypothetical protein
VEKLSQMNTSLTANPAVASTSLWGGEVQLVCPRDHSELSVVGAELVCAYGHRYRTAAGMPIMLTDAPATHWGCIRGLDPSEIERDLIQDGENSRHNAAERRPPGEQRESL